jgi:hypothetical protein
MSVAHITLEYFRQYRCHPEQLELYGQIASLVFAPQLTHAPPSRTQTSISTSSEIALRIGPLFVYSNAALMLATAERRRRRRGYGFVSLQILVVGLRDKEKPGAGSTALESTMTACDGNSNAPGGGSHSLRCNTARRCERKSELRQTRRIEKEGPFVKSRNSSNRLG